MTGERRPPDRPGRTLNTVRIALTYNLRLSDSEEEAEFDTQQTVDALAGAIDRLGHRLERFEVSGPGLAHRGPARGLLAGPHLQHRRGHGEAASARPSTRRSSTSWASPTPGSDAYALAVTLDKQLTKLILREHDVRTPGWQYVEKLDELTASALRFPVIVKPNFEGSSKGITQDSVAETVAELRGEGGAARWSATRPASWWRSTSPGAT